MSSDVRKAESDRRVRHSAFQRRITLLLVSVLGVTLLLYSIVLFRNFQRVHNAEFDIALYNYTVDVARTLEVNLLGEVVLSDEVFQANEKIFPFSLEKTLLQLRTFNGRIIGRSRPLGTGEIPYDAAALKGIPSMQVDFQSARLRIGGRWATYRVASLLLDRPGRASDFIVQVASPMTLLEKEERGLILFFLLSIPVTLLAAGLGAQLLTARATAPILSIISQAKRITARKLNQRVPVPETRDEIQDLAITLNELLDRLESAFKMQESFVADASHQLKTPLAILKGELDLVRKEGRSSLEIQDFLNSAAHEVTYLSRMVEDLLLLARFEAGDSLIERVPVRMDELLMDLYGRMQRHQLLKKKSLRLQLKLDESGPGHYLLPGDPDLLRTLLESLVDNAIKYTRPKTLITLSLQDRPDEMEVDVEDQGEGFTPAESAKLFQRFYRSPRAGGGPGSLEGSGLGLSIAQKIAELHGASMGADSEPGRGSRFWVRFPKGSA